jgi:predicted enzyme related to lactoylglutathione lyase
MVTIDTADALKLATWWAGALGGEIVENLDDAFLIVAPPQGAGPNLGFQLVNDPTPGKNKLHFDFHADDRDAEVRRLTGLGAVVIARRDEAPELQWTVLADPDGNLFDVSG